MSGGLIVKDAPHAEAKESVNSPHPFTIASGKVIVDRDHMHSSAGEGIEEYRESTDQCLALTCCHFGNLASVEGHAANELDIERHHFPSQGVPSDDHIAPA